MLIKITFPNHGHGSDFFFVLTWWIINEFKKCSLYFEGCLSSHIKFRIFITNLEPCESTSRFREGGKGEVFPGPLFFLSSL